MAAWTKNIIDAKYSLKIVERMFKSYEELGNKRLIVGIIKELAKASSNLIRAFLIYENSLYKNSEKNLNIFMNSVAPKYLNKETIENIFKSLEIEKAQRISPVEFAKGDKIIFLVHGKYRILTIERLKIFSSSVETALKRFPKNIRQV